MARLSRARVALALWTSLFLFCAIGAAAMGGSEPAAADPLTIVPADALFCIQIKNLTGAMGRIDQFLSGVSPIPFSVSAVAPGQLAKFLGSTEPKGVNMSGDFAIFGPLPGGDIPDASRIGVLVPLSDYKQFTEGNPNVTPPDAEGISSIGPKDEPMFAAANVTGYALVTTTGNRSALVEMKKLLTGPGATALAKRLGPEELKRAQAAPVWAYANVQTASKMFGPMIQAKLQEARKSMEGMQKQGQPMPSQAAMDMYMGLLNTLMQETQFVSLSLDPSASAIRAGFVAAAVPNTDMAKVLQGDSQAVDKKFLPYLENGAIMNLIMSMDPAAWSKLNNFYIDMLAKFAGKDPSSEEVRNLRKLVMDSTSALTGAMAVSFAAEANAKPPFKLQYAIGVKDPQAFYRVLDEAPKMFESGLVADFLKGMGWKFSFELKRKAETYKDVPIDAIKLGMSPTDPNSPEGKMIAGMYGQGMEGRIAVVNNLLIYAIAKDSGSLVRKLIDQAQGGGTQAVPSEVQAAMQLIPGAEKASCFGTYNYLRALQMIAAIMPMPIPQTSVQSQSDIAIAGKASGGSLSFELAVPKQHVIEIMSVFMQMQQQMMQPQQPGQPQQEQTPTPPQKQTQPQGQV